MLTRPALLLVDDDAPSRSLLAACLGKHGFDIGEAEDADGMRHRIGERPFDVVLLDVNLPGMDGLTLARELRLQSDIGIIMLTARDGQMDRVVGLEWGADDYVTKSTPLAELIARIRAVLRRTGRGAQTTTADSSAALIKFDGWTLSTESGGLISHAGERTPLTQGELAVMVLLAQNLGRVVSRSDLMLALSGREWSGTERSVDVIISRLRGKLGDPPRRPKRLMTVHGTGYRLVG